MAKHSLDPAEALRSLRAAGYEPLEPYPGAVDVPWRARCTTCLTPRRPTTSYARQGGRCAHNPLTIPADVADREFRAAGYEPLEPYPGTASEPWLTRCVTCGCQRRPTLTQVRHGVRCKHRTSSNQRRFPGLI